MLALLVVLVSYSTLRGAEVRLCRREPNTEFTAGLLSAALFSWFSPIIDVGQNKQLDLDDLPVQVSATLRYSVFLPRPIRQHIEL